MDRGRVGRDASALATLIAVGWACWELNVVGSGDIVFSLSNFDLFAEFLPRHHYHGASLRAGRLPLWDPRQIAGLPFLATLQGGVLYPPNLLYALLPTGAAMGVIGLLHVLLAGGFTYALARELGRGRAASWLAGLTFMLCGATLFASYHTNAINSVPWLPAALLCTARLGRASGPRGATLLALVLCLQFLAGRDYTFVMTVHTVALFAAFQVAWMLRDGRGARAVGRYLAALGLAGFLAGGLAAAQVLPTLTLAAESGRSLSGLEGAFAEIYGPLPAGFFLANLVDATRGGLRREYVGWIPLLLALVSFRVAGRDRTAVFASVLMVLALVLCLGSQTPLYTIYRTLPLGSAFRLPDRFVLLFCFGVALLAAGGFDRVFDVRGSVRERLYALAPGAAVVAGFALLLGIALASGWLDAELERAARPWGWYAFYGIDRARFDGISRAPVYLAVATCVLALAASRAGRPGARAAMGLVLALAAADLGHALSNPFLHPARDAGPALAGASCYARAAERAGALGRHLSVRLPASYALKDKDGELFARYSATHYDPLVTRRHAAYFAALQQGGAPLMANPWAERSLFMGFLTALPAADRLVLLDLLGTRIVLADGRANQRPAALTALLANFERVDRCAIESVSGRVPVDLYANPRALPRAFVVHRVATAPTPEAALARVVGPSFDPRREAVVEADASPLAEAAGGDGAAEVEIVAYASDRVVVRARSDAPGLLVLTDSYDPDWRAWLDGRPVPVYATDGLFRGVAVPAGASEVVFRYEPAAFRWGAAVSAVSAVLCALVWLRSGARRSPGRRGAGV